MRDHDLAKLEAAENRTPHLVAQKLAGQSPEGVEVEETARQVDELELLHFGVNEELRGGERRDARPGWVSDVHSWKQRQKSHPGWFMHKFTVNVSGPKISADGVSAS